MSCDRELLETRRSIDGLRRELAELRAAMTQTTILIAFMAGVACLYSFMLWVLSR